MKSILFFFLLIFFIPAKAQKVTQDILDAAEIKKIVLTSDEIYRIKVKTAPGQEIKITTRTEGEYFNEISLDETVRNKTLFLSSRYNEMLQDGYDKLSAHKVFSMEIELEIPRGMTLEVNSNVASVYLTGIYDAVLVQLKTGSCYLEDFVGDAVINTYDGNIFGRAGNFSIEASSRHGTVEVPEILKGNHKMVLTSINGDIKVSETK